jgi:hypothetical protein
MLFIGVLQPTHPALRAVNESGGRLMMAEGGKAKLGTSRLMTNYLAAPKLQRRRVHEIEVRRLVVADGVHHRRIRAVRDGLAEARFLA